MSVRKFEGSALVWTLAASNVVRVPPFYLEMGFYCSSFRCCLWVWVLELLYLALMLSPVLSADAGCTERWCCCEYRILMLVCTEQVCCGERFLGFFFLFCSGSHCCHQFRERLFAQIKYNCLFKLCWFICSVWYRCSRCYSNLDQLITNLIIQMTLVFIMIRWIRV